MTKKREPRDRMTPYATVAALILSIISLCLTVYWHRQEFEDRVIVRVGAVRDQYKDHSESPQGNLYAQVVNIGARPIYIRKVELMIGKGGIPFFSEDDLAGANGELKRLAPGEEADFKMSWDFSQYPVYFNERSNFYRLTNKKGKDASASVYIETTRASIDQPADIYEVTDFLTNTLPRKPVSHPPSWRPQPPVMKSITIGTGH